MGSRYEKVMSTAQLEMSPRASRSVRRFGYGVAIAVNVVLLVVVNNILEWGWVPFLTDEFADVAPWINFSLAVTLAVNVIYLFNDAHPLRAVSRIGLSLISLGVTYLILRVFPFDFSNYVFNWGIVVRVLLILMMVGTGIGVLTEARSLARGEPKQRKEVADDD